MAGASSVRGLRLIKALENYSKNDHHFDSARILRHLKIQSVNDGKLTAQFKVTSDMCNVTDSMFGGYSASVADAATQYAYVSHPLGSPAFTTNMNVVFLGTAEINDEVLVEVTPVRLSNKTSIFDCSLTNKKTGQLITRSTTSLLRSPPEYIQLAQRFLHFDYSKDNV